VAKSKQSQGTPATVALAKAKVEFTAHTYDHEPGDTVYVSGGRRGLDIGLAPADLITVTRARTAAISR
jgi:Cys-tRNA(Pro)/Cys-tRNA(Cys) deacylase